MRHLSTLFFLGGFLFLMAIISQPLLFGQTPMLAGGSILASAPQDLGTANIVTAVVLGYRGFDTLGELAILFAAASAAGLVLGKQQQRQQQSDAPAGFILKSGSHILSPLLLLIGAFIILHGHLTPGGGFQGGVILAAAFFLPALADPSYRFDHPLLSLLEGLAGLAFIIIGLMGLIQGEFLRPLLTPGVLGTLFSAGTLPLLYLAVGLKVGVELAGLLAHIAEVEAVDEND